MASDDPHQNDPGASSEANKPNEPSANHPAATTTEAPTTVTPPVAEAAASPQNAAGSGVAESEQSPPAATPILGLTNAPPVEGAKSGESLRDKVILIIVELVIVGGLLSLLGVYYVSLKKFEDIKWTQDNVVCNSADCQEGKKNFHIYRFGEQPVKDVKVYLTVLEPSHEIKGSSITQYEPSVLDFVRSPTKQSANGVRITLSASDGLDDSNSLAFNFNELTSDWIYEVSVDVRNKKNEPIQKFSYFQIRDKDGKQVDHQGLIFKDHLRLYSVEGLIAAIIVVLVIGLIVWVVGSRILL